MSIRHGGPRPRRYAGVVIRGFLNNTGGSRHWLITVTVHSISARSVVRKSVDDTHGCAIVVPSATMHVQNYAGIAQ